jgi:ubiquitin-conjugating enzyme E2 variant
MNIELISVAAYHLACVFIVVSIADLICGLVHWFEDAYGQEQWPIIGAAIIVPNRLHHVKPRAFVLKSWWQSSRYQVVTGIGVVLVALWAGWMCWELMLFVVVAANGNEVHKWAHRTRAENGRLISWLQAWGIVQNHRQHARHHRGLRNSHYCTITTWVNPVVDTLQIWRFLEFCIGRITGVMPVLESTVSAPTHHGPKMEQEAL